MISRNFKCNVLRHIWLLFLFITNLTCPRFTRWAKNGFSGALISYLPELKPRTGSSMRKSPVFLAIFLMGEPPYFRRRLLRPHKI